MDFKLEILDEMDDQQFQLALKDAGLSTIFDSRRQENDQNILGALDMGEGFVK